MFNKAGNRNGFTLIELVIVVVVVGIIAIVAIPHFIDLQKDSRISALHGLKGAIDFSSIMVHDRAVIAGTEKLESSYDCYELNSLSKQCTDSARIMVVYGRPRASEDGLVRAMYLKAVKRSDEDRENDGKKSDFVWVYDIPSEGRIVLYQPHSPEVKGITVNDRGDLGASSGCGIIYQQPYMQEIEKQDDAGNTVTVRTLIDYKVALVDKDC